MGRKKKIELWLNNQGRKKVGDCGEGEWAGGKLQEQNKKRESWGVKEKSKECPKVENKEEEDCSLRWEGVRGNSARMEYKKN